MILQLDIPNKVIVAFAKEYRYAELLADGALPAGTTDNQFLRMKVKEFIREPYKKQKVTEAIQAAAAAVVVDDDIT